MATLSDLADPRGGIHLTQVHDRATLSWDLPQALRIAAAIVGLLHVGSSTALLAVGGLGLLTSPILTAIVAVPPVLGGPGDRIGGGLATVPPADPRGDLPAESPAGG